MPGGVWGDVTRILLFDLDETLYAPETGVMDCIRDRMSTRTLMMSCFWI